MPLIVEIWVLAKVIHHTLLLPGEEIEKVTRFLAELRNTVVKQKPGDSPKYQATLGGLFSHPRYLRPGPTAPSGWKVNKRGV
jgi:hypothetical protein